MVSNDLVEMVSNTIIEMIISDGIIEGLVTS